jgi:hypothetical protein
MGETEDYVFLEEWLGRQSEPMPEFGDSLFTDSGRSPLAMDRLPERKQETFFDRKEVQTQ